MNAPAVVIRLPLEGTPLIIVNALSESEERRLAAWIETKGEYAEFVERALALE